MHNLRQNVCRLFYGEAEHLFPKSEKKLDYYHQKMNVQVGLLVTKQLKAFKNIHKKLGIVGEYPAGDSQDKLWQLC